MKKLPRCTWEGCSRFGRYAIYQFLEDDTKIWLTDLCVKHEHMIADRNAEIRKISPGKVFVEV